MEVLLVDGSDIHIMIAQTFTPPSVDVKRMPPPMTCNPAVWISFVRWIENCTEKEISVAPLDDLVNKHCMTKVVKIACNRVDIECVRQ